MVFVGNPGRLIVPEGRWTKPRAFRQRRAVCIVLQVMVDPRLLRLALPLVLGLAAVPVALGSCSGQHLD